jgi:cystathionine gamma-synthase
MLQTLKMIRKYKNDFVETPTNPMLILTDLKAVSAPVKKNNLITVCDNTL